MAKKTPTFKLPPHGNAAVHKKLMERLRKMTPEELAQTVVKSGIVTKTGKLAKAYRLEKDKATKGRPAR